MKLSLFSLIFLSTFVIASTVIDKNTRLMWQDEKVSVKKDWAIKPAKLDVRCVRIK